MRDVPVCEVVADVGEICANGLKVLVGEVAQPPGDVRVGFFTESFVELGRGDEGLAQSGEDAVVGGGQLGEGTGGLVSGGGFADPLGNPGDGGAQRQVVGPPGVGVEVLVAVDVVPRGSQPGDRIGGEAGFFVLGQASGASVIGLVDPDDGDEPGALQKAVRLGVPAAGEELVGVQVAADVQKAVGKRQRGGISYRVLWGVACPTAGGAATTPGWLAGCRRAAVAFRSCWTE
ncbi:hypothetical protein GCM10010433_49520 [Streptomyces pulveraceus]